MCSIDCDLKQSIGKAIKKEQLQHAIWGNMEDGVMNRFRIQLHADRRGVSPIEIKLPIKQKGLSPS